MSGKPFFRIVSENCEHDMVNLPTHGTEGNIKLFMHLEVAAEILMLNTLSVEGH